MKLFDGGRAPNPRRVRIFLAEKGISVPLVPVDMAALEHKKEAVSSRNPLMRLPVLELDDGTILTETIAICRYFEELQPQPVLFGSGALGKAVVEMWQRRVEQNLFGAVAAAFRHIHPLTIGLDGFLEPYVVPNGLTSWAKRRTTFCTCLLSAPAYSAACRVGTAVRATADRSAQPGT